MRFFIVKNKHGQVPPQSSCEFLPPGGTIGRSVDNNLVLPDEERSISRLQAIVHISADGECCITNRGNVTRVQLNNIPLERGRQVELQDGDILGIDDYQIQVNSLQQRLVEAPTPRESAPTQATDNELHQLPSRQTDPAVLFNSDTPFDQDPILVDTTPSALRVAKPAPKCPTDPVPSRENHTDAPELDPLALFGASSPPITSGFQNNDDPLGLMASSAETLAERPVPLLAAAPAPEAPKVHIPVARGNTGDQIGNRRLSIDPVVYSAGLPPGASTPEGEVLEGPLLMALLQGLGLDYLQTQPRFDEQQLHQVGRLLSLFSQGTVALLSSRSILKRGVNAEMTMILDEANNPFKLLPSGKTVLMQMFDSKMPGFMLPEPSVRDALIDLQAHQLGMIAAIQALIAAMLQSFNPEGLEEEARQEGALPRLAFPSSRKAALWDYFVKRYQKTSGELEDDFHTLFGEAFLHAYGVEANQYKDSQTKPDNP